jgi:hypothetical protein
MLYYFHPKCKIYIEFGLIEYLCNPYWLNDKLID